ncbi:hypothetical protein [Labilibacter marinus]|uniref:hypothetical protein n=1 Tax=Labilibacter marinus TaxID=1477105 RepID=UPI0008364DDB|nr:hypothetical protein [Labilibacter marinus]
MKSFFLTLALISLSMLTAFSQKPVLKISDNEIIIPFGNSVVVGSTIEGKNLNNHKFLYNSKITGVLDYNTAFNNVNLDNLSTEAIVFKFSEISCCGAETISLIIKSNLGYDFTFKYKTIDKDNKFSSVGTSSSKNVTSFTSAAVSLTFEAIVLFDFELVK